MAQLGERVGAILSSDNGVVKFLGYGLYEGDYPYPGTVVPIFEDVFGEDTEEHRRTYEELCHQFDNPRIKLDSGDYVWGRECWWGPVARIKERFLDKATTVIHVTLERDADGLPTDVVLGPGG